MRGCQRQPTTNAALRHRGYTRTNTRFLSSFSSVLSRQMSEIEPRIGELLQLGVATQQKLHILRLLVETLPVPPGLAGRHMPEQAFARCKVHPGCVPGGSEIVPKGMEIQTGSLESQAP